MDKIKNILKFAMRMEKDAGDFYSYYMDKAESESTRKLFSELAEIERHHFEILKSKFDQLGFSEPPISISWVVDNNFLAKDPHIISDNSDIIGEVQNSSPDLSIIRMAYLIENDFALFYRNAVDAVEEPEVKKFLLELSEWENKHRDLFFEKYQQLLKENWNDILSIIIPE